jgi:hypothetical protein
VAESPFQTTTTKFNFTSTQITHVSLLRYSHSINSNLHPPLKPIIPSTYHSYPHPSTSKTTNESLKLEDSTIGSSSCRQHNDAEDQTWTTTAFALMFGFAEAVELQISLPTRRTGAQSVVITETTSQGVAPILVSVNKLQDYFRATTSRAIVPRNHHTSLARYRKRLISIIIAC